MMSAANCVKAEELKALANSHFAAGKYGLAEQLYAKAIKLDPNVPAYWSNRAFANIKLENYGYAIRDATEALKIDPGFIKAYYRRASANMSLGKFKESLKDLKMVTKYAPNDPDARRKYLEVEKIVRRMEFEKALSYDEVKKSIIDSLDMTTMSLDSNYTGYKFENLDEPINIDFVNDMVARFERQERIPKLHVTKILKQSKALFASKPSLVHVKIPQSGRLTICGDVHGQFYDLLNIFKTNGFPSNTQAYLFNGDFVDRGSFSVEIILTLLAYACVYPDCMYLSRGNHEADDMNRMYGFEGEMKHKYSEQFFKAFSELFCYIPLCNVVENRVFVVHGGLFHRDDVTLEEISKIDRVRQPPSEGLMCEMLWADPMPRSGRAFSKRGVGLQFGPDVTDTFLKLNNLDLLVRSHEMMENGYRIDHDGKCVTIFSAPNYCDQMGNKGAFINVTRKTGFNHTDNRPELEYNYCVFDAVPHPPVKTMQYAAYNQFM